jgi:hypothetical protein
MKFEISYNTAYDGVDPDKIVAYAQHAEACGFEALYLPEHIVLYPGARVGSTEIPASLPIAVPGGAATATFLAVRSVPTNAACKWTSPGRPPSRRTVTPKRWSTRAGDRSACPSNGSRHSPHKA